MNSTKQIKMGALISYFSIFLNIIGGLLYTPWMVSQIGKSDYGLFTLSNSLITLFLVDFGLSAATARFLSKYIAEKKEDKVKDFLTTVYKLYLIIDFVIFIALAVVFLFIDDIYKNLSVTELEKFKVVYCISAVYSLINFPCINFNGVLTAYEKFIPLKSADIIYRISVIVFNVIALYLNLGLYALVTINSFCGLLTVFLKYLFVSKSVKIKIFNKSFDKKIVKQIFAFSVWATVSSLMARLVFNITPSVMGITVKNASSEIAVFGVVTTLEGYIYTISTVLCSMFLPKISRILLEHNVSEKLTNFAVRISRIQFFINGLVICGFAVIGKEFVYLWMGQSYTASYSALLLIIVPAMYYNCLTVCDYTLVAKGLIKYQALISIITGVTNIILVFPLTYKFGVLGGGLSIGIAYSFRVIAEIIVIKLKTEIIISHIFKKSLIRLTIMLILAIATSFLFVSLLTKTSWAYVILKGIIVCMVYLAFIIIMGINKEEKSILKNFLIKLRVKFIKRGN